jgi:3-phenylpropionate/trans-cinnamate dioxygenase ferredoxin subunit
VTARDYTARPGADERGFERVARVDQLPEGTLLGVTRASGGALCLFNAGGRIGAMADVCTHQAFPMSEGTIQPDGTVQCSWHGARFDGVTGEVCEGPAAEPIRIYAIEVRDGEIWVGPPR